MPEFTQNAKQILRGKDHIADCIDAETAAMIVGALNVADQIAAYLDAQADKRPRRRQFTQGIKFAAQEVRARMWEQDA